jgi:mono/diheme cytochrome c family protein
MRSIVAAVCLLSTPLAFAAAPPSSKELLEKGKASFNINCVACHGPKGAGDGPAAVALNPKPRNYATDTFKMGDKPEDVFKSISAGVTDTQMVAFGHLPEQDRWALTYYVLELRAAGKGGAVDAGAPAAADAGTKAKAAKPAKK